MSWGRWVRGGFRVHIPHQCQLNITPHNRQQDLGVSMQIGPTQSRTPTHLARVEDHSLSQWLQVQVHPRHSQSNRQKLLFGTLHQTGKKRIFAEGLTATPYPLSSILMHYNVFSFLILKDRLILLKNQTRYWCLLTQGILSLLFAASVDNFNHDS